MIQTAKNILRMKQSNKLVLCDYKPKSNWYDNGSISRN